MQKKTIFLKLFLCCFCYQIQSNNISIIPIPQLAELPSNTVPRVFQDSDGFIWFGTMDGLCRYDAYQIAVFRSNIDNPNLLTNNEITCVAEDKNGKLWIGTRSGINILDRENFQITRLKDKDFESREIKSLLACSGGKLWIGTNDHLFCMDVDNYSKQSIAEIPIGGINCIYEDTQGNIWICIWNNGLHRINKEGEVTSYPPIGLNYNNPFRIFQDSKNQFWICTWGSGVYRFYPNAAPESMYINQPVYTKDGETENTFFSIIQDHDSGYIWLMSYSGIYALEYSGNDFIRQVDVSYLFKNSNKIFSDFIKDRDGNLWVGSFSEGAFSINFDKPEINNLNLNELKTRMDVTPNVTAIYEDKSGIIWFNQNRLGLCLFNQENNNIKSFRDYKNLKDKGLGNIFCIREIDNKMWLGFKESPIISIVTKNGEDIIENKRIDLNNIINTYGGVTNIFQDKRNNIWIATLGHLFVKPYSSENIQLFSKEFINTVSVTEDPNGNLWFASTSNGIRKITFDFTTDLYSVSIKEYSKEFSNLPSNNIRAISSDRNGDIWIGTQEGNIFKYNQESQLFDDFSFSSGLSGEAIQNIIIDDYNNIWISTNKRIVEFNPESNASRDYSVADGLIVNSLLANSCYYNPKTNTLFYGGNKGISAFTPKSQLTGSQKALKVKISDIKIQNQSIIQSGNGKFKAISQALVLQPNDKNIEIDFSTLDYTFPNKIMYAYKMEGIDDDWVYTKRNFATYNQLKKGETLFQIKATDENSVWGDEITTLHIYKHPAFYETWWAYTIYTLLLILAAYMALRTVRNRIRLRNELKIAQIEKEKSEELIQTKLRYFTNISHDFLTPLTIVSCLIDDIETIVKKKIPQFDMMRSNVTRLRRLLQQVLDFRRVENGKMKLKISENNISKYIKSICENHFSPLIEKKNISFSYQSVPDDIIALFDIDKVDKIVFNILSNALKYTNEGGRISVKVTQKEIDKQKNVFISISDTGVGIHPNDLKDIFTRFYSNRTVVGTDTNGIGLSLTKELVELHHGTISVESELNKGTTFTILIPIDKNAYTDEEISSVPFYVADENSYDAVEEDLIEINEEEINKEEINLLLVEDNEDLLFTIKNILQRRYHVFTATDGQIALNILKDNDIDIIVSDVMMPNMDGLELCKNVKTNIETSHIPILLLTAKNSVEDRIECYDAGADGYISKPFNVKVLEARISNFLQYKKNKKKEFQESLEINITALDYPSIDEIFLSNAVKVIEDYLSDHEFGIDTFSQEMKISKSSLYRKIKTMTGLPPNEFIRNIRLKHACLLLKDKSRSISDAAYTVGFTDPRYFSTCFKNEFNMTPTEYQKQQE